ncbi:MAG: type IV pilus assembly protein PilE [Halioglobus sp.]|jgi:type IV pilus assembly protein PilE
MEIMIVVAIIGILLAVALPSYQDSLIKGRRSDGMSALLDATNRQERLMLDRSTYTDDMEDLGFAANPFISSEGHYSVNAVSCASGTIGTCYVLTATPVSSSPQAKDTKCAALTLDSSGAKGATGSASAECW